MRKCLVCLLVLLAISPGAWAQEPTVIPPAYEVPEYVVQLLEVATEELGYTESRSGVTKYGQWTGFPRDEWCAEFLCWSVFQVDQRHGSDLLQNVFPYYTGSNVGRQFFIEKGRYVARSGHMSVIEGSGYQWFKGADEYAKAHSYIPQPGDWVFFTWRGGTATDHVAIVEYCTREADGSVNVHIIEGNNPSTVQRNVHKLTDKRILGYGTVHDVVDWTLEYREEGEKVRLLQKKLAYLGLLSEEDTDGVYGKKTIAAIDAFQIGFMEGKASNGIADISTQNALNEACIEKMRSAPMYYRVIDDEE